MWIYLRTPRSRLVCTAMILACVWLAGANQFAGGGEKFAIVIGVNDSPDFRLPGGARPRPLVAAERDADAFAQLLRDRFDFAADKVRLLKGPAATQAGVRAALQAVAGQATRVDDQVVFYFSGHGTQVADRGPLDEPDGLDEALCLSDSTAEGAHLLLDDELGRWLDRLPAQRATVLLDCCHAGTGTKELGDDVIARFLPMAISPTTADLPRLRPAAAWLELVGNQKSLDRQRTAFFACLPDQQAYERRLLERKPVERRGQFSYYFIESFSDPQADADGDGKISNSEALNYVRRQIDESFNKQRSQAKDRQQPTVEADRPDGAPF